MDFELFAGAGGLTLGLQESGFKPRYLFEFDGHCCATLRHNSVKRGGILQGEVQEGDVRVVDWTAFRKPVRILAGGAPCQPFSLGGKHLADRDGRNLFPEVLRAARELEPAAMVLENVQGLSRPSFRPYFEYLVRQLESPSIGPTRGELWQQHDARLRRYRKRKNFKPDYDVSWELLNAADFGVPQSRRRVFFVATRARSLPPFEFPKATHSRAALIREQSSGAYWQRHGVEERTAQQRTGSAQDQLFGADNLKPWRTVRDALAGLPGAASSENGSTDNHWLIPGARLYTGHQGSHLDWPSKTIKAGVHGVPGGENVVHLDDGTFRYLTLRETARIQTFPDEYYFTGARTHVTRQIGNAVPCLLAKVIGSRLFSLMREAGEV